MADVQDESTQPNHYEGCSSYSSPPNVYVLLQNISQKPTNSIEYENIDIYEEIPDRPASYLSLWDDTIPEIKGENSCKTSSMSLRDDTTPEIKNEKSSRPCGRRAKLLFILGISISVMLGAGVVAAVVLALSLPGHMTSLPDATQQTSPAAQTTREETTLIYVSKQQTPATTQQTPVLTSCAAIYAASPGALSGRYIIYPGGRAPGLSVPCDMVTGGGGWTLFQRRQHGELSFSRTWADYKNGFGSFSGELWLGNEALHRLTAADNCSLRVDLWDRHGNHTYALYNTFAVGDETNHYRLKVSGYSGNAGSALNYHNARPFSTADQDHDTWDRNCAAERGGGGGWWYASCLRGNLNGRYTPTVFNRGWTDALVWGYSKQDRYIVKSSLMMMRPRYG